MDNPIENTIDWVTKLVLNAFGRGTPIDGMRASAILFVVTFSSNFIGLVFTIVLDILFAILFLFNAGRWLLAWWRTR